MNLLGFIAIVIGVTGVMWLLQLIFKDKTRIDIILSVNKGSSSGSGKEDRTIESNKSVDTSVDSHSILGDVVLTGNSKSAHGATTPQVKQSENKESSDALTDDSYIDQALADETFEDYTSESILKEDEEGIHAPALGQITLSPFASITDQLPADSFANPQTPEQIEAMFDLLRESTLRIEQQMMALYEVVRSQSTHPSGALTFESTAPDGSINDQVDITSSSERDDQSNVYSFDDDDDGLNTSFGSGLNTQLEGYTDEAERGVEYFSVEELGGELPEDAVRTYDLSELTETEDEQPKELLPYLASLNKTGELSHDIVDAIKKKESTKVVRHRVRQLIRAIDHYRLNNDGNAALRVTAVMSQLPTDLGKYAASIYDIARKFGLAEPESEPDPVEVEEALEN